MNPGASPGARVEALFAATVQQLHLAAGGLPEAAAAVARCARAAWRAGQAGDACVEVDPQDRDALARSPAVFEGAAARQWRDGASPRRGAPLVLDEDALYLTRLWRAETTLAAALAARATPAGTLAAGPAVAPQDEPLQPIAKALAALGAQQRAAVAAARRAALLLLTGGPGTGKTRTLGVLIAAAVAERPGLRLACAAPTGKAAARLRESLLATFDALPADVPGVAEARARTEALTLHRLLGFREDGRPAHGPDAPLPHALVVVDEASMIDLELGAALLAALGPDTRLVLCGDPDQLSSVEAGAIFADAVAGALPVARLTVNHRQADQPALAALAEAVRAGQVDAVAASVSSAPAAQAGVCWHRSLDALEAEVGGWCAELARAANAGDADAAHAQARRLRVLAALREGPQGVESLNRQLAQRVRARTGVPQSSPWYPGRLVVVRRNQPALGLHNGDIGVAVREGDALVVAFDDAQARRYAPAQVPPVEDAFALTIHLSQGSEFDAVALVLPPAGHPLATRELLYTGITRARRSLFVIGDPEAALQAVGRPTTRSGRLRRRLAAAVAARGPG